jgi:iron complex outermembrane receptor protein
MKFETSLFTSQGENIITINQGKWMNSGEFNNKGYEISVNWLPSEALQFSTSWSQIDLQNVTVNVPEKKLTFYTAYNRRYFSISASLIYMSEFYGDNASLRPLQNYTLLDLTATIKAIPFIGLRLGVKNLLDQSYQTYFGYPMPGRMFTFDTSYTF